jgi:hypothetical protein
MCSSVSLHTSYIKYSAVCETRHATSTIKYAEVCETRHATSTIVKKHNVMNWGRIRAGFGVGSPFHGDKNHISTLLTSQIMTLLKNYDRHDHA